MVESMQDVVRLPSARCLAREYQQVRHATMGCRVDTKGALSLEGGCRAAGIRQVWEDSATRWVMNGREADA